MKKTYSKPRLYAETFELMEHISAMCSGFDSTQPASNQVTSGNEWVCGYYVRDGVLFNNSACTVSYGNPEETDPGMFDIYCYNAPLNQPGSPFGAS